MKTYFREDYVDLFTSLWGALDWVFNNEENAIILEEDCVASLAFFDYSQKLLAMYKNEPKVWMISGNNFTPKGNPEGLSYFYTRYAHIYGWATWSDRWKKMDREMVGWPVMKQSRKLKLYSVNGISSLYHRYIFNQTYKLTMTNWDSVFVYNCMNNNAYGIIPNENLVSNIGVVGVNHSSKYNEYKDVITSKKEKFSIAKEPNEIAPTGYDSYHFKYHILKPLIIRKLELIARYFYKQKD